MLGLLGVLAARPASCPPLLVSLSIGVLTVPSVHVACSSYVLLPARRQTAKTLQALRRLASNLLFWLHCPAVDSCPSHLQVLCPQVVQVWLSEVTPLLRLRCVAQHNVAFNDPGHPLLRSLSALTGKHMPTAVHGLADESSLRMLPKSQQSSELTGGTHRPRVPVFT